MDAIPSDRIKVRVGLAAFMSKPRLKDDVARNALEAIARNTHGILAFTEIAPFYREMFWRIFSKRFIAFHNTAIPVTFSHQYWRAELEYSVTVHKPIPFISPWRGINVLVLKRRRSNLPKFCVVHTHMDPHRVSQKVWQKHAARLRNVLTDLVDNQGLTVILTGDFNKLGNVEFHPRQKPLLNHGYCHIAKIEPNYADRIVTVNVTKTGVEDLRDYPGLDHAPMHVDLELTRA